MYTLNDWNHDLCQQLGISSLITYRTKMTTLFRYRYNTRLPPLKVPLTAERRQ